MKRAWLIVTLKVMIKAMRVLPIPIAIGMCVAYYTLKIYNFNSMKYLLMEIRVCFYE